MSTTKIELISDPKVFGPGMWFDIHVTGWNAKSEDDKKHFIRYINNLISTIQCLSCRSHGTEYISQNPPMDYWNQRYRNEDVGMFKWTFNFHNAVNARLGKPVLAWETAYNLYSKAITTYCSAACGSGGEDNASLSVTFKSTNFPLTRAIIALHEEQDIPPVTFANNA